MKYFYSFILFIFSFTIGSSQVTINPSFPTVDDDVTITFNASKGNGALQGVSPVYMHTGLITSESNSPSDWKHVQGNWGTDEARLKMTAIGNNKHELSFNIRQFYNVPASEMVEKLAFVFRNVSGSIVGRASDGSDIFSDIYESSTDFLMNVTNPSTNNNIVALNEPIYIRLELSKEGEVEIFDNNVSLHIETGTSINKTIILTTKGKHDIKIRAINNMDTLVRTYRYIINEEVVIEPIDIPLGINRISETSVTLALYAPNKENVYVLGSFNDYLLDEDYFMKHSEANDIWWLTINDLDPETEYTFQYLVDGTIRTADPFSEKVLDSWNDKYIESETYPDLIDFPIEHTSGIVTTFKTSTDDFEWENDDYDRPKQSSLIVYELLLRDFLETHSYNDLRDTLDYLERLGINAIELMPVNEFEGNRGWGYNPSFHMALDKYYGTPEAFKLLIDEAHRRGMAIILDVVYNHAFSQSPLAKLYWDAENFRPTAESPYLNVEAKHPYNVGYDFNHESDATKYFVDRCLNYWIDEYHIDGFRFDLSKGFTQKKSTNDSQMAAYDQSRINILKHYANTIWDNDPDNYVILEHFATSSEEKVLVNEGMMIWGNSNHDYTEASMGFGADLKWSNYKARGFSSPNLVSYMESHDEERIMYKNNNYGKSFDGYNVRDLDIGLERAALVAVFHLMTPGPKMIWQFGELGYDYSINTCEDGSISSDCRLSPKPIRWDYLEESNRLALFNVYAKMNGLRKEYDIFNTENFDYSLHTFKKKIRLMGEEQDMILVGNFDIKESSMFPLFTKMGMWYEYFSGDSISVNDINMVIDLEPGEYRLYASKKFPAATSKVRLENQFEVYPNPCRDRIFIKASCDLSNIAWIIYDISGRSVLRGELVPNESINISTLEDAIYLLKLIDSNGNELVSRFIKN